MTSKSSTITQVETNGDEQPHAIHPSEILLEEFLRPMGISQYRLAGRSAYRPGASTIWCTAGAP